MNIHKTIKGQYIGFFFFVVHRYIYTCSMASQVHKNMLNIVSQMILRFIDC